MVLEVTGACTEESDNVMGVVVAVVRGVEIMGSVDVGKVYNTEDVEDESRETGPGATGITTVSVGCEGLTIDIDGEFVETIVSDTVVAEAGSLITTVEIMVCVNVSNKLRDIVTVPILSEFCVIVLVTVSGTSVAVTVDPPSTGTTEYGTRFCFCCSFSGVLRARGRVFTKLRQHDVIKINKEQKSFITNHNNEVQTEEPSCLYLANERSTDGVYFATRMKKQTYEHSGNAFCRLGNAILLISFTQIIVMAG